MVSIQKICSLLLNKKKFLSFSPRNMKMEKDKIELEERYNLLTKKLQESFKIEYPHKPVSNADTFYEITDRNIKHDEQLKIMYEIIEIVELYNDLPLGTEKAKLRSIPDHSQKLKNYILDLSKKGWFINYDMSPKQVFDAVEFINKNELEKLDEFMTSIIDKQYFDNVDILLARHTDRFQLLEQAFGAHERGEYFLSIPVIISQADGISNEYFRDGFLFTNKSKKAKEWADTIPKESTHIIMSYVLKEFTSSQLAQSFEPSKPIPIGLSRHAISHGFDKTYGTKLNSLKAMSFLRYISDMLSPREVHGFSE